MMWFRSQMSDGDRHVTTTIEAASLEDATIAAQEFATHQEMQLDGVRRLHANLHYIDGGTFVLTDSLDGTYARLS